MMNKESLELNDPTTSGQGPQMAELFPVEAKTLTQLYERIAEAAAAHGYLEVAYRTIDTPVGCLLVAATEAGVVRVAFEREGFEQVLGLLAQKISPRVVHAPRRLDAVAAELEEYFAGTRTSFEVPLDYSLSSGFRQTVQQFLPHITYGHTQTYKEVAANVGNPKAIRAVGTACATNPLPVIVPCHRVLRSDGGFGGYLGGLEAKKTLLTLESAA